MNGGIRKACDSERPQNGTQPERWDPAVRDNSNELDLKEVRHMRQAGSDLIDKLSLSLGILSKKKKKKTDQRGTFHKQKEGGCPMT